MAQTNKQGEAMKYSSNPDLERVLGKRDWKPGTVGLDRSQDFYYMCPKCGNEAMEWSEYNGCVWCQNCNLDIPTCLAITELDNAIDIFVKTVGDKQTKYLALKIQISELESELAPFRAFKAALQGEE